MTNILIHLATLIFVVTLGKQFVDTKCQENFDVGFKLGKSVANAIRKYEEGK
jgi:hypothetical protein